MSEPLVSCICPTRNRRKWLPKAIECFLAQTYRNRELVIVADGDEAVTDLIPNDPRIRLMVTGLDRKVVGVKRNIACEAARGEMIAHWDDDDFSAPARLVEQMAVLEASGKAVTGYHTMKFTDGSRWWQYRGSSSFAMATSLFYRKNWWQTHRFQEIQCGQDENFAYQAAAAKQLFAQPDLELMYATIHPGNTSPRPLSAPVFVPLPGFEWRKAA